MQYRVKTAYFARGDWFESFDRTKLVVAALDAARDPVKLRVIIELSGPAQATDWATLLVLQDGLIARLGPKRFAFDANGTAILAFVIDAMPVSKPGRVSAQLLFPSDSGPSHVCGLTIRPPRSVGAACAKTPARIPASR